MTFTHEPRAPYVASTNETELRYFGPDSYDRVANAVRIFRFADDERAKVSFEAPSSRSGTGSEFWARMSADELRELARRCLDAAHDLETIQVAEAA